MRALDMKAIWVGITAAVLLVLAAGCSSIPQALPAVNTSGAPATAAISATGTAAPPAAGATEAPQAPAPAASTSAVASRPTGGETLATSVATATETSAPAAVAPAASTASVGTVVPMPTMAMSSSTTPAPSGTPAAATSGATAGQASAQAGIQYRDDFSDVNSGWPNGVQFGNYFIGYHEPNHYHVDVHAPHDRAVVSIPKHTFTDFTMEAKVMAEPNNTAKTGDFRYGLVFRRSGNDFYAFVVSPHTKNWAVLKSSPDGVTVLTQGTNAPTQGLTADDTLRVDAKGSSFFFTINGQLLGAVENSDYTTGEAGFYVETFDSPRVHAHWGTVIVRDVELPALACTVQTYGLNIRSGPDTTVYPVIDGVRRGGQLQPLGRDATGNWMKVRVPERGTIGWVLAFPAFLSCNVSTNDLAVATQ